MSAFTELTEKQEAAIRILVTGAKIGLVCREIGITRKTLRRWREQPAFSKELESRRNEALDSAVRLTARHLQRALETFVDVMEYGEEDRDRVVAAKALIQQGLEVMAVVETRNEIESLKARLAALSESNVVQSANDTPEYSPGNISD